MKRGMKVSLLVTLLAAGLLLFTSMNMAYAETTKPVELKFSIHTPPPAVPSQIVGLWAKEVEEKTGGKVKVTIYHAGSLVPIKDVFPSTQKGICDIAFVGLQIDASR
jgi:TRAP-type C4-dicarboxylate transport system substrate-binding protein